MKLGLNKWLVCVALMVLGVMSGTQAQAATYTVAGNISGLPAGKSVVLKNNSSTLNVTAIGGFVFPAQAASTPWNVTVAIQPAGLQCAVSNASGSSITANVTNVGVSCVSAYMVSGTVSGLSVAGLVLKLNNSANLVIPSGATSFKFATGVISGSAYEVKVGIQPTGYLCTVTGGGSGTGSGTMANANITNVAVSCVRSYTIGGTVSGLTAAGLILNLNGGATKTVASGASTFTFSTSLASGSAYSVTVAAQPTGQNCVVNIGTGSGTVGSTNVSSVLVTCSTSPTTYTIGGTVSGLGTGTLVLNNNSGDAKTITADGTFTFPTAINAGTSYSVTVATQPTGKTCSLINPSGTASTANVTNVGVNCTDTTYTITGTNSTGASVSIGGSSVSNSATTAATFGFTAKHGESVTVAATKVGNACSVVGTITNPIVANVSNLSITCTPNVYTLGVSNPDGATVSITGTTQTNAPSTATGITFNTTYGNTGVSVSASKSSSPCTVAGTTIPSPITGNVTGVTVSCSSSSYTVAGNVFGLTVGQTVTLLNNAGNALPVSSNGSFVFTTPVSAGSPYTVTVGTQPTGQTCVVSNGSGASITANVWGVVVSCAAGSPTYTISGSITMNGGHFGTGTACTGTATCATITVTYGDSSSETKSNVVLADTGPTAITAFSVAKPIGTAYSIALTLSTTNKGQCAITNPSGVITTANMTYEIQCVTPKNVPNAVSIGGSISGLAGNLVLTDSGGDSVTLKAGTTRFTMPWNPAFYTQSTDPLSGAIVAGGVYSVTVASQPTGQTCAVYNGSGIITNTVANSSITNINVTCVNTVQQTSSISGSLLGLSTGQSLTLLNNGGDNNVMLTNGGFTFGTNVIMGSAYNVTVSSQPLGQLCTVTNGTGTSPGGGTNISNVSVVCVVDNRTFTIGGTVSGLTQSVTLLNNGTDTKSISTNGSFTFANPLNVGTSYTVTIATQPSSQTCFLFNNSGTNLAANVTSISVACSTNTYQVGGNVSGLTGAGLVLQSDKQTLSVSGNGSFAFSSALATNGLYSVFINTQPVGQTCTVTNGSGLMGSNNITSVVVTCVASGATDYNVVLGQATENSVTISVLAPTSAWGGSAYVDYSTSSGGLYTSSSTVTAPTTAYPLGSTQPVIEVPLTGLTPNTKYYYRVYYKTPTGSFVGGNEHSFYTQRAAGSTFSFGVQGDSHPERFGDKMFHSELYQLTMAEIAKRQPDLYFMLGDDFSTEKFITNFETNNKATGAVFANAATTGYTLALYGKGGSLSAFSTYSAASSVPNPFNQVKIGEGDSTAAGYGTYLEQRQKYLGLMSHSTHLYMVNGNHEQESMANLGTIFNNNAVFGASARNKFYPQPKPASTAVPYSNWSRTGSGFYSGDTESFATGHVALLGYPGVDGDGLLRDYYAFEWGDALFITIDPYWHSPNTVDNGLFSDLAVTTWQRTMGDVQYFWLKSVLENSTKKYKFIFTHHINGTGRGGASNVMVGEWGGDSSGAFKTNRQCAGSPGCLVTTNWPKPIHQLLVDTKAANGFTVFFQGHDHAFAREEVDGVIYQSLANPSDNSYWAYNCSAYSPTSIPSFPSEYAGAYGNYDANWSQTKPGAGFVYVTVSPQLLKLQYIRTYRAIDLMLDANKTLYDSLAGHANGEVAFTYTLTSGQPYSVSAPGDDAVNPYHCFADAPPAIGYGYNHYSVSGSVSGLAAGKYVTLMLNSGTPLTLSANGSFTFPTTLNGGSYAVTLGAQPAGQTCAVSAGSGSIATYPSGSNVTNVSVTCN